MVESEHYACIVCSHVFNRERPVLWIAKHSGYPPEFMCGAEGHHKGAKIIGYSHLIEHDPSLKEVGEILEGYEYERVAVGGEWTRRVASPET